MLTAAERQGDEPIDDKLLHNAAVKAPKVWEFNRVAHGALKNWIVGDAKKLVTYGVRGGSDAWRRLYNEYLPMDQTQQDIILTEIISLEPVKEKDVGTLLNRVEELRDKHDRCGEKPLAEHILKRIIMKCLPNTVIKPIAIALGDAKTFRDVRRFIMRQMHNVVTGMMDGDMHQPIYSMQTEKVADEDPNKPSDGSSQGEKSREVADQDAATNGDLNAATKGKGNGKGKGYGQCWNCGGWGHPRRECLQLIGQKGDVNALKGKGKGLGWGYKGGYKGGKGKGLKGSKGKGYKGYRFPGKAIGKGPNYYSNEDYAEAWGDDYNYEYYDQDYNQGEYGYIGILAILWEKQSGKDRDGYETVKSKNKKVMEKIGERRVAKAAPEQVQLQNKSDVN